jgi:hypothetical protein
MRIESRMFDDGQWRVGWEETFIVIPLIVLLTVVNHLLDAYELISTRTRQSAPAHPSSVSAAKDRAGSSRNRPAD